jgi:hypothetical protein
MLNRYRKRNNGEFSRICVYAQGALGITRELNRR